jgi:hypothetical protein
MPKELNVGSKQPSQGGAEVTVVEPAIDSSLEESGWSGQWGLPDLSFEVDALSFQRKRPLIDKKGKPIADMDKLSFVQQSFVPSEGLSPEQYRQLAGTIIGVTRQVDDIKGAFIKGRLSAGVQAAGGNLKGENVSFPAEIEQGLTESGAVIIRAKPRMAGVLGTQVVFPVDAEVEIIEVDAKSAEGEADFRGSLGLLAGQIRMATPDGKSAIYSRGGGLYTEIWGGGGFNFQQGNIHIVNGVGTNTDFPDAIWNIDVSSILSLRAAVSPGTPVAIDASGRSLNGNLKGGGYLSLFSEWTPDGCRGLFGAKANFVTMAGWQSARARMTASGERIRAMEGSTPTVQFGISGDKKSWQTRVMSLPQPQPAAAGPGAGERVRQAGQKVGAAAGRVKAGVGGAAGRVKQGMQGVRKDFRESLGLE